MSIKIILNEDIKGKLDQFRNLIDDCNLDEQDLGDIAHGLGDKLVDLIGYEGSTFSDDMGYILYTYFVQDKPEKLKNSSIYGDYGMKLIDKIISSDKILTLFINYIEKNYKK